jgi:hypothetical protein
MSYCRWSCDDYRCDLYCYEDVSGGYTTHVASSRYHWEPPSPSPYDMAEMDRLLRAEPGGAAWQRSMKDYNAKLAEAPIVPIGLSCDGQSFNDPDLASFRQRVADLIEMGYRVPPYVLETIDEEIADETAGEA